MQLARMLFPGNVIRVTRLSAPRGKFGEIHSDHYPLAPQIKQEALEIRGKILGAHKRMELMDGDEKAAEFHRVKSEVEEYDEKIRKKFPQVAQSARMLEAAGFSVPHPEVNFTIRDGKVVFYEVDLIGHNSAGDCAKRAKRISKIFGTIVQRALNMAKFGDIEKARAYATSAIKLIVLRELSFERRLSYEVRDTLSTNKSLFLLLAREEWETIDRTIREFTAHEYTPAEINRMLKRW